MNHNIFPETKQLGFGLMRLPETDGNIDIEKVCTMVDQFMAHGFTYFDTAYVYEGSEEAFRKAVVQRYPRDQYTIADKMAGWLLSDTLTPQAMFAQQLSRCGVEYFDFYLLHSLQPSRMAYYDGNDCWSFCQQKKSEGRIRHFGFSYHGAPDLLEQILTQHPEVDFVQLQINYVDWEDTAIYAGENYQVCRKFGKPIIVMEPVKGGILANLNEQIASLLRSLNSSASAASYALRFAASLDGVAMVLSGMSSLEQMEDNLRTFSPVIPLSTEEKKVVEQVKQHLLSAPEVACTSCGYCVPGCPEHIHIPEIFKSYNMIQTFGDHLRPHLYYDGVLAAGSQRASSCIHCGRCEQTCPQHLSIIAHLQKASELLDQ